MTTENNNTESRRSFFHIFRDVYTETRTGTKYTRREWLRLTPSGRYIWTDQDHATDIKFNDSCRIVENLQTHGNAYRYNYGKLWQY